MGLAKLSPSMRGTVLMLLSSASFAAMSALVKLIPNIDSYKTSLFRFMIGLAVMGTAAQFGKVQMRFVNSWLLLLRGVCHGIGVFLFFLSISSLICLSLPVFNLVVGLVSFRERLTLAGAIGALLVLGACLVVMTVKGRTDAERDPPADRRCPT